MEQVALIGLGVMGANLIRNIERNGFEAVVYNRTTSVTDKFIQEYGDGNFKRAGTLLELTQKLKAPRTIILMVQAGKAVDVVVEELLPLLSEGDIVIDGGNSYFKDTQRREINCKNKGVNFIGMGVSGGEEGALKGPSIMPGGDKEAVKRILPMLEKISAKADGPCAAYIGKDGSGHFVKMVHNGIEYGDMQLIAEAYDLLKRLGRFTNEELQKTFSDWNKGVLSSFLIEITAKIFEKQDGDGYLVDKILDSAGQKGTGRWTASLALELGVPIPTLASAVDARALSSRKSERVESSKVLGSAVENQDFDKKILAESVHDALYAAKILTYAQGWDLMKVASSEWSWGLNFSELARIWKGGCIIRAQFLDRIQKAYLSNPELPHLLYDPSLREDVVTRLPSLRKIVSAAALSGIPVLSLSTALGYYDSYRSSTLPQNLTQAQRDFFGAHTYQRVDKEGVFHTEW